MTTPALLAAVVLGVLHGLEPGHGWPVATLYATQTSRSTARALLSSGMISMFHLISSLAVVGAYVLLSTLLGLALPYVNYLAGGALLLLSLRFFVAKPRGDQHGHEHGNFEGEHAHEHRHPNGTWHTHTHRHRRQVYLTLSSIALFAFVLGFAHEEEFVLLALAVGGVDPLLLMVTYASAVTAGLMGITVAAVRAYARLAPRLQKYERWFPQATGLILAVTGASFLLGLR
jgi:ABC-type nickel/cobalt efflux system permease component RcnA